MKKLTKWLLIIFGIIALLSLLIGSFDWAAEPVAKIMNKPLAVVKGTFQKIAMVALAGVLIVAAIASIAAAPVVGVVLLAVGITVAAIALWPLFTSSSSE